MKNQDQHGGLTYSSEGIRWTTSRTATSSDCKSRLCFIFLLVANKRLLSLHCASPSTYGGRAGNAAFSTGVLARASLTQKAFADPFTMHSIVNSSRSIDYYACSYCLRLRHRKYFSYDQLYPKGQVPLHPQLGHRFCLDCGLNEWHWGRRQGNRRRRQRIYHGGLYPSGRIILTDEHCYSICGWCGGTARNSFCISCNRCGRCLAGYKNRRRNGMRWNQSVDGHSCPRCSRHAFGPFSKSNGLFRSFLQIFWLFGRGWIPDDLSECPTEAAMGSLAEAIRRKAQRDIDGFLESDVGGRCGKKKGPSENTIQWIKGDRLEIAKKIAKRRKRRKRMR